MGRDTDFNGAGPLVHHLVDADLEHLVGAERPAAQDHAVVEVISRTAEKKTPLSIITLHLEDHYDFFQLFLEDMFNLKLFIDDKL